MSDLYSEFDKSLYKAGTQNSGSSEISTESLEFGSGLEENRTLTANTLIIGGGRQITISPGQSIQKALDTVFESGGGKLFLTGGRFVVNAALTGYPNVSIEGISPSATILDFNSTVGNLSYAGTNVYATGTITSISGGVNVTGSGTSWLANASAGQYLFIGTRHYLIAAVTGDTTLILAQSYSDDVTMPGAAYRITTAIVDVVLKGFSITGSTGTGLTITDGLQLTLDNVQTYLNNKGMVFTNVSLMNQDRILAAANTSNGIEYTNVGLCDWESVNAAGNGGHNFVWNNVKKVSALMSAEGATSDGFNFTDVDQTNLIINATGNGGQGMELVSGCDDNIINGLFIGNTSDGVKLTGTSDRNKITGIYKSNGGYGINIAAATDDDNTIDVPTFSGNSSGTYNDSGTNTNVVATVSNSQTAFGGSGMDGALSISSGTTTIDCANAATLVKNYSSISITGTGKLAFSNPHASGTLIYLKSQGTVTLTSSDAAMIDVSGMGAAGGSGGGSPAVTGTTGQGIFDTSSHGGGGAATSTPGTGGVILSNLLFYTTSSIILYRKMLGFLIGSGGGGGSYSSGGSGGAGGRGGGSLIIESKGALNFTTGGISAAGNNGVQGTTVSASRGAGSGGGGGGGSIIILYNSLTANTGSLTVTGGTGAAGGLGDQPGGNEGSGGAGAGSYSGAGTNGANPSGNNGGAGGNGADGFSLVAQNNVFA